MSSRVCPYAAISLHCCIHFLPKTDPTGTNLHKCYMVSQCSTTRAGVHVSAVPRLDTPLVQPIPRQHAKPPGSLQAFPVSLQATPKYLMQAARGSSVPAGCGNFCLSDDIVCAPVFGQRNQVNFATQQHRNAAEIGLCYRLLHLPFQPCLLLRTQTGLLCLYVTPRQCGDPPGDYLSARLPFAATVEAYGCDTGPVRRTRTTIGRLLWSSRNHRCVARVQDSSQAMTTRRRLKRFLVSIFYSYP